MRRPGCLHRSLSEPSSGGPPICSGYRRRCPTATRRPARNELATWIGEAKATLGERLLILGHHYQRDEVMRWADARGDSYGLSRLAADSPAEFIVFCGVHFMAESADILTGDHQAVILPDLNAGCSMADMADIDSVEEAWEELAAVTDIERIVPITYMNSSAALKAFVGRKGGAVCTSSNARAVVSWALERADKLLFFPDQHLGRNTAYQLGFGADDMRVWNPTRDLGGLEEADVKEATFLLWKGHCSVHQRFTVGPRGRLPGRAPRRHRDRAPRVRPRGGRGRRPGRVHRLHHPGRRRRPRRLGDRASAPRSTSSSAWPPSTPTSPSSPSTRSICPCSTMFRIDAAHLAWVLENLVEGRW